MAEPLTLRAGDAHAQIDLALGRCTSLVVREREVLGADGLGIEFPWVGAQPARPARLRLAGQPVAIGGGDAPRTWQVTDASTSTAEMRTEPSDSYPFAVRLTATWQLDAEGLRLTLEMANPSRQHAPFGLGVRAALAPLSDRVALLAPAEEVWPSQADAPPEAITPDLDFRRPKPLTAAVRARFTRRHFANLQTQLALLSPDRELWLTTSADFREADVAIQPDGSGTLESATCTPDAFARQAAGLPTGLRLLAPGEMWHGHALLVARQQP